MPTFYPENNTPDPNDSSEKVLQKILGTLQDGSGGGGGGGDASAANQVTGNTSLASIDTNQGAKADTVATTDTGTFSVVALIKRGLQSLTSILAKLPTLVSGRIPVDGSGVTQPVTASGTPGAWTNRSGTITVGNTAQVASAALAGRKYFLFANNSTGDLWIDGGATAVVGQPSIRVLPGMTIIWESNFIPNTAISVIGATTGQSFTAKEA